MNKIKYKISNAIAFGAAYAWITKRGGGFTTHPDDYFQRGLAAQKGRTRKIKITKLQQIEADLCKSGVNYVIFTGPEFTTISS